jgi:hypothetical protein
VYTPEGAAARAAREGAGAGAGAGAGGVTGGKVTAKAAAKRGRSGSKAAAAAAAGGGGASSVNPTGSELLEQVIAPIAEELGLPIALKFGAHRAVNPSLRFGGDGVVSSDVGQLRLLCQHFPKVKVGVLMYSGFACWPATHPKHSQFLTMFPFACRFATSPLRLPRPAPSSSPRSLSAACSTSSLSWRTSSTTCTSTAAGGT